MRVTEVKQNLYQPKPNLLGTSATVVSRMVKSFCTLNTNVLPRRVFGSCQSSVQKMLNQLKDALDSLCKQGIVEAVTEPTEWVNSLVIVEKKLGDLRLCIDLRSLNQGIQREHYSMHTVEAKKCFPSETLVKRFTR